MKSASSAMIALLATNNFYMADLYTFTLIDGSIYYFTSADINISYGGNTYLSIAGMEKNNYKLVKGTSVDSLSISIFPDLLNSNILINGIPLAQAAVNGALDGALCTLNRTFMPTWGDTSGGVVKLFSGKVSTITGDRTYIQIDVKSMLEYFNIQMPKNLFQAPCSHILYDTGCSLSQSSFTTNFTLSTLIDNKNIATGLANANGYFTSGVLTCLTGVNAGAKRSISNYSGGTATVAYAFNNNPQSGDTFSISAGCDKTMTTCKNKFNNFINYRGMPFVPVPESIG